MNYICLVKCQHTICAISIFKSPSLYRSTNWLLLYFPLLLIFSNSCKNLNYYYYTFINNYIYLRFTQLYYIDKMITYRIRRYTVYIGRRREGGVGCIILVRFGTVSFFSLTLFPPLTLSVSLHHSLSHTVGNTFTPWCGVCVGRR